MNPLKNKNSFMLCLLLVLGALVARPLAVQGTTYTLDGDFDLGTLVNVNHDAPNNDCSAFSGLSLSQGGTSSSRILMLRSYSTIFVADENTQGGVSAPSQQKPKRAPETAILS